MNANLPQLDLPRDYVVGNDITEAILNFYKQTCRLKAGIFALCVEGNLRASINLTEYTLKPNDFITLMPGSIIQFCEQKESFRPFLYRILIRVHGLREHDKVYDERLTYYLRESDHITE